MHTDPAVLAQILVAAGIEPTEADLDALVSAHTREQANLAEIRNVTLAWDGPEPETANRWLESAGE